MNQNSRTVSSIKNIVFSLANQIITLGLGFISRYIFIKILGAEYLGINGLFSDILMMLSLADLGLGSAITYSFYKPLFEKDEHKISALTNFYKKIYSRIASAVAVIGLILVPFIDVIVNVSEPIPFLKVYYILFLLNSVASYLFVYKSSLINADQRNYIISFYSTLINIIKLVFQTMIIILTNSYVAYLLVQILCTLINNVMIGYKANRLYPFLYKKADITLEEKKSILENVKSVFLYKISGVLLNGTDNILISILVSTVKVGYYSNYNMIIGTISRFIGTIFTSLNASLGSITISEKPEKRYEIFKVMQMISFWLSGIASVGIYLLIGDFVQLWIGKEFVFDQFTLIAILSNFYIACTLPPIWSYREATGLFRKTKYIMLITAIVNIIASILMGIEWGLAGIIMASTIAKLSTYFWLEPIILFKDYFKVSAKTYFFSHIGNLGIVMIIAIMGDWIYGMFLEVSWASLILKTIIYMVLANIIYFIVYAKTKELKIILNKLKSLRRV